MAGLNSTPRGERLHIGIFGRANGGKSSLINKICGGEVALVSEMVGTTTDPVYKSMEIGKLGPVVLIDTAGFDDLSPIGDLRLKKTVEVMAKTDLAILLLPSNINDYSMEKEYLEKLNKLSVPTVVVYNEFPDVHNEPDFQYDIKVNCSTGENVKELLNLLETKGNEKGLVDEVSLTEGLVNKGDLVLLVMPQDIQAPKGRLILPQVQTIRDLLDKHCLVMSVTRGELESSLDLLGEKISLVITDSQIFKDVNLAIKKRNLSPKLTSFSLLQGKIKGDINSFVAGAKYVSALKPGDKVLIVEACTHHSQKGDIAREKLPTLLENYVGGKLDFTNSNGATMPDNIGDYKLIIHCGACMINRKNMLSRILEAKEEEVPITNFGVAFAFLNGILDEISY